MVPSLNASPRHARAIAAVADLLTRQRVEFLFLGEVARGAWLEREIVAGSVDALALMQPQQKNAVAMMASHRGFRVDRAEIEQSEELDLVPLHFEDADGEVRVHVLLASNALYAKMFAAARATTLGDLALRVPAAEDLALLLSMADDVVSTRDRVALVSRPDFDRHSYNAKVVSIGLPHLVV